DQARARCALQFVPSARCPTRPPKPPAPRRRRLPGCSSGQRYAARAKTDHLQDHGCDPDRSLIRSSVCESLNQGDQMRKTLGIPIAVLMVAVAVAAVHRRSEASDHDDGEQPDKSRELNLTDHYSFKSPANPSQLSMI